MGERLNRLDLGKCSFALRGKWTQKNLYIYFNKAPITTHMNLWVAICVPLIK